MHFEHLVEINDLLNPLLDPLSREDLWNGLVAGHENPSAWLPGLDECRIVARTAEGFERELRFGSLRFRDRVRLMPHAAIEIASDPTPALPGARKNITLEEHGPGALFVRFTYERLPQGHPPMPPEHGEMLKQAWLASDLDLIVHVRSLAAENEDAQGRETNGLPRS
jgi:hypothetical protein